MNKTPMSFNANKTCILYIFFNVYMYIVKMNNKHSKTNKNKIKNIKLSNNVMVAPYCMPGSDTIRSAISLVNSNMLNFTLAFWNNGGWDSGVPDDSLISDINNAGGEAIISFGGYAGCNFNQEPALLGGTIQQIVERYIIPIQKYNFRIIIAFKCSSKTYSNSRCG